jgi:hypothetical protein
MEQLDFFEKNVKMGSKMEFYPNRTPFFCLFLLIFEQNEIDPFFWPILAEFFIPPGNMYIQTFLLRNNSIFLKKM